MRIIVQNRDNRRQLNQCDRQRQLRNLTKYAQEFKQVLLVNKVIKCIFYISFLMLFRLFVIVGVVWILEIVTYICALYKIHNNWTKAAEFITCSQGIILFVVTILKKDVLKALAER